MADGVRLAQANDLDAAERRLTSALSCGGSAPLRELAGLRLLAASMERGERSRGGRGDEDPTDAHAWRLLATSRFVQDDRSGALEAWNHVDEPRVDLIRVDGLVRTRQRVVEDLLPIARNDVLTSAAIHTGASSAARAPVGRVRRAHVRARTVRAASRCTRPSPSVPLVPTDRWTLAALGVVAAFRREVEVSSGALTGGGERITLGWRFWPGRPRVSAAIAAPAPWGGVWGVDAFTERQPFTDEAIPTSRRRGAHVTLSDWVTSWARASVRGGVERWDGVDTFGERRDRPSTPDRWRATRRPRRCVRMEGDAVVWHDRHWRRRALDNGTSRAGVRRARRTGCRVGVHAG